MEANRAELAVSMERLHGEVARLTDWRAHVERHKRELLIGAAVVGLALGCAAAAGVGAEAGRGPPGGEPERGLPWRSAARSTRGAVHPAMRLRVGGKAQAGGEAQANSARGIPPTPTRPGPDVGADHRADLGDEQRLGAVDLASALDQALGLLGGLDVLHHPCVGARLAQFVHVLHHPLERPPRGAHALDGRDFVPQREDRLDPQRPPDPRLRLADASRRGAGTPGCRCRTRSAARHASRACARSRRPCRRPARAAAAPASTSRPRPPQAVSPSITSTRSPRPRSASRPRAWRAASQVPEMPAGEVHRDDVLPVLQQRLPYREEVPDRGLGGGGQVGVGAQALIEGVEALHLALALFVIAPPHVQADLVDAFAVRQRAREVVGGVGDDRYRGHGASTLPQRSRRARILAARAACAVSAVSPPGSRSAGRPRRPHRATAGRRLARAALDAEDLRQLAGLVHLGDDVAAPDQLAVHEQLWDRGPVGERRELLADAGVGEHVHCGEAARRAPAARRRCAREKPHAGASGVPFMKRITGFSAIACSIATRIGLDSVEGAAIGSMLDHGKRSFGVLAVRWWGVALAVEGG